MTQATASVTAIAVLSAHGAGLTALVDGIRAGHCPVRPAVDIGFPTQPPPLVSAFPARILPPGDAATATLLLETIDQLIANWDGDPGAIRRDDTALIVGSGGFLFASGAERYWRWQQKKPPATPFLVRGPAWGSELITAHLRLCGTVMTLSTGCSSSANALLTATEMLQRGRARRVLVVGVEGLSAVTLSGFDSLMLLDPNGCRPFDKNRMGLQIGEGIAALMLEADPEKTAHATILGGANLCDIHHLTSAGPDGAVMRDVMVQALASAGISRDQIAAVKAHGTGSIDSDRAEANALCAVFGASLPPVIGLKRYVGHTLGACGGVELAAMIGCLQSNFLPPTAGFETIDPEIDFTPTRVQLSAGTGNYLLNFFGFGGNYTSLVMAFS
jgi:3-oxoacyl-(acyl-carrier-protein) synthase